MNDLIPLPSFLTSEDRKKILQKLRVLRSKIPHISFDLEIGNTILLDKKRPFPFHITYNNRVYEVLFYPYLNDSDDCEGKLGDIRELNNLMDVKYFAYVSDDILEHLKDNTSAKDIVKLIKNLDIVSEDLKVAKADYQCLSEQHKREGDLMQKVLKNYIDEKRKLKEFIRKINKKVPRNLC